MSVSPLTDLRDEHNDYWHEWARRNPDDYVEHSKARSSRMQDETSGRTARLCEFVDADGNPCLRKHHSGGFCSAHVKHIRKWGEARPLKTPRDSCSFVSESGESCAREHYAKGLCGAHYRQRQAGRPLSPVSAVKRRRRDVPPPGARDRQPWAEWEFQVLMAERPLMEIALELGRTYSACVQARRRRLKMLGLHRPRIKTEQDPYDGSVVSLRPEWRNE